MSKIAVVFPGQGSQFVGMLADINDQFSEVRRIFSEASDHLGYDLWKITQEGPAESLNQTAHAQPAILTGSYAIWEIIKTRTALAPVFMAGHSLGEYTALVCADALPFAQAVRLVAARGQFMQEAVPNGIGAMAAVIGLENEQVAEICEQARQPSEVLAPANYNSIGQVVIAGHKTAVERAMPLAKAAGAKLVTLIPVSVPSHCELMKPAAHRLQERLVGINFQVPSVTIINNVDVTPYTDNEQIKESLTKQLYSPVRWLETMQYFAGEQISMAIECGPGKVLSGLLKRITKQINPVNTNDINSLNTILHAKLENELL